MIGQGANDPRVKQLEADQIVKAMQEHKIPVTYVLYPDEGHGFARPENRMSFNAVTEAFLAEQLGGRFEPVGKDFDGSTIQVPAGADDVPGLSEALERNEKGSEKPAEEKPSTLTICFACYTASIFRLRFPLRDHNTRHEPHLCVLFLVYLYPPGLRDRRLCVAAHTTNKRSDPRDPELVLGGFFVGIRLQSTSDGLVT